MAGFVARADFPGGNAHRLWQSIQRILALPDETRLFTGHDYQPGGRSPAWESTVAQQKAENAHVNGHHEASFVKLRTDRDRTLPMPKLIDRLIELAMERGAIKKSLRYTR